MNISELNLPKKSIDFLLEQGYTELYPPQEDAVKAGIIDGESVLVSAVCIFNEQSLLKPA